MKYEVCHLSITTDTLLVYFINSVLFKWWYLKKVGFFFFFLHELYFIHINSTIEIVVSVMKCREKLL